MWDLHDALKIIRETQETAKGFGFHISLAGGVLNKGFSENDLDLLFIPLSGHDIVKDYRGLEQSLEIGWGVPEYFGYSEEDNPYKTGLRFVGTGSKVHPFPNKKLEVFIF